jgi:thiamine biosynthesis protein ThiI
MMYRIAEEVAKKKNCRGLVTGESLGQVASQTLDNLNAVSQVVSMSVFRPLIGMDKLEIIQAAKELGTFEISIESQPDCCSVFMPPNPVTRSRIRDLEADEFKYPWKELMAEAIGKMETMEFEFSP